VQGREKDVVIFSCVRTAGVHHRSIGFVADERRINVGITRARCALLVIGHAASLAVDERWRNLVKSAVERNVMFQPEKPYNDYMEQVRACVLCTATCALTLLKSSISDVAKACGEESNSVWICQLP
jgi:hypothetical protein